MTSDVRCAFTFLDPESGIRITMELRAPTRLASVKRLARTPSWKRFSLRRSRGGDEASAASEVASGDEPTPLPPVVEHRDDEAEDVMEDAPRDAMEAEVSATVPARGSERSSAGLDAACSSTRGRGRGGSRNAHAAFCAHRCARH